jgi:hypothetical protein
MTAECVRLLTDPVPAESREISFDLYHQRFLVSRLRRSPRCRFDHQCVRDAVHLETAFGSATLGDVVQAVEQHFGPAPVHLECRRRLLNRAPLVATSVLACGPTSEDACGYGPFDSGRLIALERLRDRAGEALADLGFVPTDRLRARTADRSAFVVLHR